MGNFVVPTDPMSADDLTSPDAALPQRQPRVPNIPQTPAPVEQENSAPQDTNVPNPFQLVQPSAPVAPTPQAAPSTQPQTLFPQTPFGGTGVLDTGEDQTEAQPQPLFPDIQQPDEAPTKSPFDLEDYSSPLLGHGQAQTVLGHFGAGINQGVRGLGSALVSLAGLGIGEVEDAYGVKENRLSDAYFQWASDIESHGPKMQVGSVADLNWNDPVGWLKYAAGITGQGVPFLLSLMATGGGTAAVVGMAERAGLSSLGARAALARFAPPLFDSPQAIGGLIGGTALETGISAKQIHDITGETRALPAVMAGAIKGFIDVPTMMLVGRTLMIPNEAARTYVASMLEGALVGSVGTTAREGVNIGVSEGFGQPVPDAGVRLLDAAIGGGLGGGLTSGAIEAVAGHGGSPKVKESPLNRGDFDTAAEEMPIILGTDPELPPPTPIDEVMKSVQEGNFGLGSIMSRYSLDDTLARTDARDGDYLWAAKGNEYTSPGIGYTDETGRPTFTYEGRGLARREAPMTADSVRTPFDYTGRDMSFGTPTYARDRGGELGTSNYVRLDKNKVKRADITSGVEDLPTSINDPRISVGNDPSASHFLIEAVRLKNRAAVDPQRASVLLDYADKAYRLAVQRGVRVEPLPTGTVRLRDESKYAHLIEETNAPPALVSSAKFSGAKKLGDKVWPFFDQTGMKPLEGGVSGKGGEASVNKKVEALRDKSLDLYGIRPEELTALPSEESFLKVMWNESIFRDNDLRLAALQGIHAPDVKVLKDFVRYMTQFKHGEALSKARQQAFFELVDRGLRLDVGTGTDSFVLLRNLNRRELVDSRTPEDSDRTVPKGPGQSRVLRKVSFEVPKLKSVYTQVFARTQNLIHDAISTYTKGRQATDTVTNSSFDPASLERVSAPIERILGRFGIKDKIELRIVHPDSQVVGVLRTREVRGNSTYSVLNINPWRYSVSDPTIKVRRAVDNRTVKDAAELRVNLEPRVSSDADLARFWTDVGNSIGHVVLEHEYGRLSQGEKDLLHEAFNREKQETLAFDMESKVARTMAHPLVEDAVNQVTGTSGNYNLDFEKWFAQGIGRWFATDSKVGEHSYSHFVDKTRSILMNRIDSTIRDVIDNFARNRPDGDRIKDAIVGDLSRGTPDKGISSFLTSMQDRFKEVGTPLLEDTTRLSAIQSRIAAQRDLDHLGLTNVLADPQRASSVQLDKILTFLDSKKDADAIKRIKGLMGVGDKFNTLMALTLGIQEIAKANPHLQGLQAYVEYTRQAGVVRTQWTALAEKRVTDIQKLGKKVADRLFNFTFDYDKMVYLSPEERQNSKTVYRRPTAEELYALAQKHNLSKEAFDVFRDINKDFLQVLGELEQVTVEGINRKASLSPETRELELRKVHDEIQALRYRPYFPHMRFGQYIVTIRDRRTGEVAHFEAFESERSRDVAIEDMHKVYDVRNFEFESDRASEVSQQYFGLPAFALPNILRELGLDKPDTELTSGQRKDKRVLEAATIKAAPEASFRKQMSKREGIPGYSMDGVRAYANYFSRTANFLARQKFGDLLQDSILSLRDEGTLVERDTRTKIADFLQKHHDEMQQGGTDWAKARALTYLWYLGFVPASAFVNMTQVPLVTFPHLMSKFGDFAATKEISKGVMSALKDKIDSYRKGTVKPDGVMDLMKQVAVQRGIYEGSLATELAAAAGGGTTTRALGGGLWNRKARAFSQAAGWMFGVVENMNRAVTFKAAAELALKYNNAKYVEETAQRNPYLLNQLQAEMGFTKEQARAYAAAEDAVNTTQFNYMKEFRPAMARGKFGTLMFMLKNYNINMANFAFRSDRGTMTRFWLTMAVAGGAMGLPLAEDATNLIKFVAGQMGYNINFEHEIRQIATELSSGDLADYLLHGASRNSFGMTHIASAFGVGFPQVDLSKNIGMGRLLPGLSAGVDKMDKKSPNEELGAFAADVLGPAFSIPWSMYQALTDHALGVNDPKRWERAMPRQMRDLSRVARYLADEKERDRGGNTVVSYNPNDPTEYAEAIASGMGFTPTRASRAYDLISAQKDVTNYWQTRRQMLMGDFYRMTRMRDEEGKKDTLAAIQSFNQEIPYPEMAITPKGLRTGLINQVRDAYAKTNQEATPKMFKRVTRDVQGLYPQAVISSQTVR